MYSQNGSHFPFCSSLNMLNYGQVLLWFGPIWSIAYSTAVTEPKHESEFKVTKIPSYLLKITKNTPISHPQRWVTGCLSREFWRKLTMIFLVLFLQLTSHAIPANFPAKVECVCLNSGFVMVTMIVVTTVTKSDVPLGTVPWVNSDAISLKRAFLPPIAVIKHQIAPTGVMKWIVVSITEEWHYTGEPLLKDYLLKWS